MKKMDSIQKEIIYLTMQLDLKSRKVRAIKEEIDNMQLDSQKVVDLQKRLTALGAEIKKINTKLDKLLNMPDN